LGGAVFQTLEQKEGGSMMTAKYGVGIIGAGWVSGEYVKAFRDHPLTEVVGMYNRTPGKATNVMKTHGVEGKEYASIDEFFDDERINIIVHCAHANTRPEYISRAASSGRHVVIEKPVSTNPEGVAQVREAVKKAGVKSIVSCVLRWNPQFQTIRALIDDGKLGDLIYAEADYWHPIIKAYPGYSSYMKKLSGGSSFVVAGVHAADTLRWLAGDIVEVAAFSTGPIMNKDYEYQPVSVAALKFANGAIGKLSSIVEGETPYIFNCRLFGTTMSINNNRIHSAKYYPGTLGYWEFPTVKPDSGEVSHHPFVPEINHFMECIENDVESHASIHDMVKTMNLCFAIDESAANGGQPVQVKLD
jgi:UDP-N-acetyl-2-amino-2-deoxyglucuronate dehydrogenase